MFDERSESSDQRSFFKRERKTVPIGVRRPFNDVIPGAHLADDSQAAR
jgi:hypothetical protein